jgi:hypothetical protein
MLSPREYIQQQYAREFSERYQQMLGEGLEATPSDFRYDLAAMNPKSLTARIVTDNDEEMILSLRLLKKSKESIA